MTKIRHNDIQVRRTYSTMAQSLVDKSIASTLKSVVNCQNSRDKGPPEGNSARG